MNRLKYLAVLACVLALCLGLAGCGDDASQDQAASATQQESVSATQQAADAGADAGSTADAAAGVESVDEAAVDISPSDLASPDIVIGYGDYDAMADLSANIQSAKASGVVVQVDGIVKNYGTSYSIVEESADGTQRIGTVFVIQGAGADSYPQDGQHATVTGIVDSDETGYSYFIKTLPEFVEAG